MIEISKTDVRKDDKSRVKKKRQSGSVSGSPKTFMTQLNETISYDADGEMDDMLDDLKDQEKRFLELQSLFELNRYKSIIQKILKIIQKESFRAVKVRTGKKSVELVVHEIDTKLLEITDQITRNNRAFNFLKTIDEIRGLVFDLIY